MKGSSRRFTFTSVVGLIVLLCSALLLGLCYLSMYINPAAFWPAAVLAVLEFPVAILNVALLVFALLGRSRFFWIPLVALVPFIFIADKQLKFSGKPEAGLAGDGNALKIISYNVGGFRLSQDHGSGALARTRDEALDSISGYAPDLLCLQEFSVKSMDDLPELMEKYFPGYHYKYYLMYDNGNYYGNMTASRFPMLSSGVERFEQSSNLALYNDIDVDGRVIRVYNCHFQSYSISSAGLVKAVFEDREIARATGARVRGSILKRPKQVGQVLDNVKRSPNAALICGDFNDTPMSYTYNALVKGRKDTFSEAGTGFASTYSRLWPLLRIDYILVPEFFSVLSHETPHLRYSDHYPVIAVLAY